MTLSLGGADLARAQSDLRIRASRRDTITAGATVTAAFAVSLARDDSVQVMPHIEVPSDWTVLMGGTTFGLRGRATELLMLSIVVPARAVAGVYPVRVWITTSADTKGTMDSIVVRVPQRRGLEVGLVERPGFVVSGNSYSAGFLLRNRGNTSVSIRVRARSSLSHVDNADTIVMLEAEESRVMRTHAHTREGLESAGDDVLEIFATQLDDSTTRAEASARVTVVPEPSRRIEEYLRVPTQVHLRAASSAGVSPFEVFGGGRVLDGGAMNVDFLFRGRTGKFSPFGERDEYRMQVETPSWRARAGDHVFALSTLTGGAQPGFGAGADGTYGRFSAGAYGQQFRRSPEKGTETGVFLGARPLANARVGVNLANRAGGLLPGSVASATAEFFRDTYSADVEIARGASGSAGSGMARTARLSGSMQGLSYDVGHLFADTSFSGPQRGSEHNYFTTHSGYFEAVSLGLSGSRHRTDLSRSTGVPYTEHLDLGTLSATILDRLSLEMGAAMRGTTISGVSQSGRQYNAIARLDQDVRFGLVTLSAEAGRAQDAAGVSRVFSDFSVGARRAFARGSVAVWGDQYSGGSITKGLDGTTTLGGDASLRITGATAVTLNAYATRQQSPGASWHSQLEAYVSHALPHGNTVSLRARLMAGGSQTAAQQSIAFIEYGLPLRLPVSRLRTTGRVYGRVVDAVSGHGVPGALVRLGPQVAITDKEGQVAFGGVPGGEHRVSMSQETSLANAVFVGDPTLSVDSTRTRPTTFQLAIARSARVEVAVRRFATARTGLGASADSLTDAGALANATLVLAGERDTLYRTSNDHGMASFTDVPPGVWLLTIRGDAPAFHRFDPDRIELTLAPGESRPVTFRLVPRRREVQLIGEGQELRPTAADPKASTPSAVKTVKPNEQQKHDH